MLKDTNLRIHFKPIITQAYRNVFSLLAKNTPNISRYQIAYNNTDNSIFIIAVYGNNKTNQIWSSSKKSNTQDDDLMILDEFEKINIHNAILKITKLHHDVLRGFK